VSGPTWLPSGNVSDLLDSTVMRGVETVNGALLPLSGSVLYFSLGAVLIVVGQILNASVFYRLGKVGAFYGERFGYEVPWCRKFPFSWLKHPNIPARCFPSGVSS
jgi:hypothetical protein